MVPNDIKNVIYNGLHDDRRTPQAEFAVPSLDYLLTSSVNECTHVLNRVWHIHFKPIRLRVPAGKWLNLGDGTFSEGQPVQTDGLEAVLQLTSVFIRISDWDTVFFGLQGALYSCFVNMLKYVIFTCSSMLTHTNRHDQGVNITPSWESTLWACNNYWHVLLLYHWKLISAWT